jgi:hypothetical protein
MLLDAGGFSEEKQCLSNMTPEDSGVATVGRKGAAAAAATLLESGGFSKGKTMFI